MAKKQEFLDFQAISEQVKFRELLDILNIGYTEARSQDGETSTLKGEVPEKFSFVITENKNLFLCPTNDSIKGGPINFLSFARGVDLRTAAKELKEVFVKEPVKPKREIPDLVLLRTDIFNAYSFSEVFCTEFELGWVSQKSIMAKKIAFLVRDDKGDKKGYIGYEPTKQNWFFPKGFKREMVWNAYRAATPYAILTTCIFDACHLINIGFPFCVSLMGKSMTDGQEEILKTRFKRILLFSDNPENVRARLAKSIFVKSPELPKPIRQMTTEEVKLFF